MSLPVFTEGTITYAANLFKMGCSDANYNSVNWENPHIGSPGKKDFSPNRH